MNRIITTTPAGTVCTLTETTDPNFPFVVSLVSHKGAAIIPGSPFSRNAAWALHVALTEFFGRSVGECSIKIEEL